MLDILYYLSWKNNRNIFLQKIWNLQIYYHFHSFFPDSGMFFVKKLFDAKNEKKRIPPRIQQYFPCDSLIVFFAVDISSNLHYP